VTSVIRHLPNMLTGLRLVAAPATAGLLLAGHFAAALGVFAAAGLSDVADGYLAKRYGFGTQLGRYLDPAADKALMLAAFLALTALGAIPVWLTGFVIARDVAIVLAVGVAKAWAVSLEVAPLPIGKACTVLQVVYAGAHLAVLAFGAEPAFFEPWAAAVIAGFTAASWFAYGRIWFRAMWNALR